MIAAKLLAYQVPATTRHQQFGNSLVTWSIEKASVSLV